MKKIPPAENILRNQFCKGEFDEIMQCLNTSIEPSLVNAMIKFAKLHVEAALKEIPEMWLMDRESITKSYPLTNIK